MGESNEEVEDKENSKDQDIEFDTVDEVIKDIERLDDSIMKEGVKKRIRQKLEPLKSKQTGISLYQNHSKEGNTANSQFLEVKSGIYVRKSTIVWLLQESEWVSTDRLFRVREKQPEIKQENKKSSIISHKSSVLPIVSDYIVLGDVCVFKIQSYNQPRIGRILQFKRFGKIATCKGNYIPVPKHAGEYQLLCTWYELNDNNIWVRSTIMSSTMYNNYLCTLTTECLAQDSHQEAEAILPFLQTLLSIQDTFQLTASCMLFINEQYYQKSSQIPLPTSLEDTSGGKHWIQIGKLLLTSKDKLAITGGKTLSDIHITAAQKLLSTQYPHLNGFLNTLCHEKKTLPTIRDVIQIINLKDNHWAVFSTYAPWISSSYENTIWYYDSAYSGLPTKSEVTISHLVSECSSNQFTVHIMPVAKQLGVIDCGLYSIAIATAIASGTDPTTIIFRQDEMSPASQTRK